MKHVKLFEEFNLLTEITQNGITAYYQAVCKAEGIKPLPVKFGKVKFGGAKFNFSKNNEATLY